VDRLIAMMQPGWLSSCAAMHSPPLPSHLPPPTFTHPALPPVPPFPQIVICSGEVRCS